ncbi:ecdysone receptor-like [Paramacrobiotus metropolitanus]|uniref:ecdysone receptor-like n=1 Tax=Paramacrobiotus metropolitanus TaxID=2943436 RepID=UPI0024460CDF|nr:ecdysone receptor-like [Paramacrobiotus metropolitanus]
MDGGDLTKLHSDADIFEEQLQQNRCAVCLEAASSFCYGVVTCISCKNFFLTNWNKTALQCVKESGQCAWENVSLKSCNKCRLEKCLAVGMDRRKSTKHPDRARLEAVLLGLRNHKTPNAFVKLAVSAVVQKRFKC